MTNEDYKTWEKEKLEPLQKQVAMLVSVIGKVALYIDGFVPEVKTAIDNTQAASEAFMNE